VGNEDCTARRAPAQKPCRDRPRAEVIVQVPHEWTAAGPGGERVHLQPVGVNHVGTEAPNFPAQLHSVGRDRNGGTTELRRKTDPAAFAAGAMLAETSERGWEWQHAGGDAQRLSAGCQDRKSTRL